MDNGFFVSYDADKAGRLIGRAILSDDPNALKDASDRITLGNEIFARWAQQYNGIDFCSGGDQGVWFVSNDALNDLESVKQDYAFATNLTTSIGTGKTLSESGKALLVAKFRGKNMIVHYDPSIESSIKEAMGHMNQGTASAEEKKIGEAYLQDETGQNMEMNQNKKETGSNHADCQYCQAMATEQVDDPSHCKYCHDSEQPEPCKYCDASTSSTVGADDCPYCAANSNGTTSDCKYCAGSGKHDSAAAGHPSDCQYCADASAKVPDANGGTDQAVAPTSGPAIKNPTTTDSENYAGQDLNNPDLPKPEAIQHNPDGLGTSFDTPTVNNTILDAQGQGGHDAKVNEDSQNVNPQNEESVQEITAQIDALPPNTQQTAGTQVQVDAPDLAIGTNMEDGVSRPEDFADENTPRDMGLAEGNEPPDVNQLMQEGLDSRADEITRERVVNLVSEALVGFKASKTILEKAKLQAPQLYESSIAMLKAMIEMCKMLGLDQEAGATPEDEQNPLGSGEMQDQQYAGAATPAEAHTGEAQNPPGNLPNYVPKNSNSADGGIPAGNHKNNMDKGSGNDEEGPHSVKGAPAFNTGLPRRHENPKYTQMHAQSGVHKPASGGPIGEAAHRGPMGQMTSASAGAHRNVLGQLRSQPKPSLPKSEGTPVKK